MTKDCKQTNEENSIIEKKIKGLEFVVYIT